MRRSPVSAGGGLGATGLRGCGSGSPGSGSKGLGRGCARLQADGEALPHELAAGLGPFQPLAETSIALRRAVSLESPRHGRWPPCRQGATTLAHGRQWLKTSVCGVLQENGLLGCYLVWKIHAQAVPVPSLGCLAGTRP